MFPFGHNICKMSTVSCMSFVQTFFDFRWGGGVGVRD